MSTLVRFPIFLTWAWSSQTILKSHKIYLKMLISPILAKLHRVASWMIYTSIQQYLNQTRWGFYGQGQTFKNLYFNLKNFYFNPFKPMEFPIFINWTSLFPFWGLLGCIFHFYQYYNRSFCKQTVETLIRRHILWHLIWVCTVCLCSTKRTLGLYGLIVLIRIQNSTAEIELSMNFFISQMDSCLFIFSILQTLRSLVAMNENLKKQEQEFKAHCKEEMSRLKANIEKLKSETDSEMSEDQVSFISKLFDESFNCKYF